jgi:hypothetical protein
MGNKEQKILKQVKKYQSKLIDLQENCIIDNEDNAKPLKIEIKIYFCSNGLIIQKTINKNVSNVVLPYEYGSTIQKFKQENGPIINNLFIAGNKEEILFNKVYNYRTIKDYNGLALAQDHFDHILDNNYLFGEGKIKCVDDVISLLNLDDSPKGSLIYRGQINEEWALQPSLFRNHNENASKIEASVFERLIKGERSFYQKSFDPLEHMINLQHFGVPTRLLDWSSDFFISLFFACFDEQNCCENKDGALYVLFKEHFQPILVNDSNYKLLKNPISEESVNLFERRLQINDIFFIEPSLKNPRLRSQDGCFLFFPFSPLPDTREEYVNLGSYINAKNNYYKSNNTDANIVKPPFWIGKMKVDMRYKKSILKELEDNYGISKDNLYVKNIKVDQTEDYYMQLYSEALNKSGNINKKNK